MKKIRIGIMGAGRGIDIAENLLLLGCEIAALCENNEKRAEAGIERLGIDVPVFDDFEEFIEQEMDAVVLANYFHEHAPYAIKCFEKGIHVLSECISNGTMAQGVELLRAFEKSNSVYMIGENYPQMIFNREMRRVCDGGSLGKILYAEGEYNHPISEDDARFKQYYIYFREHWRNYLPATYYVTHSLGPLMWITGAVPKRVTAFAAFEEYPEDVPTAKRSADRAAIITTQNDQGGDFRYYD